MRRIILFAFTLAVVLTLALISQNHAIRAQTGCDATSINGPFGYTLSGYFYDNQGYLYILGSAGRIAFDGAGNLSGADTFSFDGTISKRTYTGTYTLNQDCTGSLTLQPSSGGAENFDMVAVNGARQINLIESDTDNIFTGSLLRQTQ